MMCHYFVSFPWEVITLFVRHYVRAADGFIRLPVVSSDLMLTCIASTKLPIYLFGVIHKILINTHQTDNVEKTLKYRSDKTMVNIYLKAFSNIFSMQLKAHLG